MYDKALIALIPSGYRDGGLYSVLPANGDGDFNFTRSSTATRVNKDGLIETIPLHTPRLDYPLTNSVVGDCPHLLLEPIRTNLFPYSNFHGTGGLGTFTSGTSSITVTNDYATSPDGTQNAMRMVATCGSTSSDRAVLRDLLTMTATDGTLSFYGKSNTGSNQRIAFHFIGGNKTVVTLTNEWQRFTYTETSNTGNYAGVEIRGTFTDTDVDVLLFGFQMEQASYATSYIPTENDPSGVTRSADFCNLSGIGAEFNTSEGVLFVESAALADDLTFRQVTLNDSSSNTILVGYRTNSNRIYAQVVSNNVSQAFISYDVADITEFHKIALKYSTNSVHLWIDGVKRASDTSATMPTSLSELDLQGTTGSAQFYAKTKQVIYFNEALSDSELQTLTS